MVARIALIRHGQTEWSASGQHTSVTDIDLTAEGVRQAGVVKRLLAGLEIRPVTVYSSPRLRSIRTAELAGLHIDDIDPDLAEWNYGSYEGLTSPQIHAENPGWSLWTDGAPGGETPEQVSARADRMLDKAREALAGGDVVLVCHGHFSRTLAVRWAQMPIEYGAHVAMSAAAVTVLSIDRGTPILDHVNVVPFAAPPDPTRTLDSSVPAAS